jgi:hypothetical protein
MKLNRQFDRAAFQKWCALLLVLVVALFGFAQAVHLHDLLANEDGPNGPPAHCLICVSAHSAPVVTTISPLPALALTAIVLADIDPQLRSCLIVSSKFIRPPPQVL